MKIKDLEFEIDEYEKYLSKGTTREEFEGILDSVLDLEYAEWIDPDDNIIVLPYRYAYRDKVGAEENLKDIVTFLILHELARVFKFDALVYDEDWGELTIEEILIIPSDELNDMGPSKYYDAPNLKDIIYEDLEVCLRENYIDSRRHCEKGNFNPDDVPEKIILSDIVEIE